MIAIVSERQLFRQRKMTKKYGVMSKIRTHHWLVVPLAHNYLLFRIEEIIDEAELLNRELKTIMVLLLLLLFSLMLLFLIFF